jgi:hypothetical protein
MGSVGVRGTEPELVGLVGSVREAWDVVGIEG